MSFFLRKRHQIHFLTSCDVKGSLIFQLQMFVLQPLDWTKSKSFLILHPSRCLKRFVCSWINCAAADYSASPDFTRIWFVAVLINQSLFVLQFTTHDKHLHWNFQSNDWLTKWLIGCTQNAKLNFKLECLSTPGVLNYLLFPTASSKLCWKLFSFSFLFFFSTGGI